MILFPNCKINLGLDILSRRPDGYHDIETVMYPIGWTDILEIVPGTTASHRLFTSGRSVDCPPEKNLVFKALRALEAEVGTLPPVDIYLRKIIPDGAGLGGGSADAAFTLRGLNDLFHLNLPDQRIADIAATIGADCPFFIYNRPMLATGTGTTLNPIDVDLSAFTIVVAKPDVSVPTRQAYSRVTPRLPDVPIPQILDLPVSQWTALLKNDFEASVFPLYPQIARLKESMTQAGAIYSAMSGSGSAVFGIFDTDNLAVCERFNIKDCYISKAM